MATLTINGKRVKVDDSFLQLSPEQQNATVDEIASQMGASQPAPQQDPNAAQLQQAGMPVVDPSMQSDGNSPSPAFQQALAQLHQAAGSLQDAPTEDRDRLVRANMEATKINNMQGDKGLFGRSAEAVPGGATLGLADELYSGTLGGAARMLRDQVGPVEAYKREMALQAALKKNRGDTANLIGDVAGGAALGGIMSKGGASFIDKATSTAGKILAGGAEGAGYSAASGFGNAQGVDRFKDAGTGALIGGAFGAGVPALSAGLRAGYNGVKGLLGTAGSVVNPESEAANRIANAMKTDRSSAAGVLSTGDVLAAAQNNQPLMNIDRGGENTRALARSAANQSPEARGMMEKNVSDRFANQNGRVVGLMDRITGGQADDLAAQDVLRSAAKAVNQPAYNKAYQSPAAQQLYTPELQQLMQSPAVRKAVQEVEAKSANRSAIEGTKAIKNPFHEAADGSFKLRQKADGTFVAPTLQFWDQVKRNLDDAIGPAQRAGEKSTASDLIGIKNKLVNTLDAAVPEYKAARQGAASFFGAEDALDAGKKFAKSTRLLPEYKRGIMAMKAPERELFKTGFASEIIDAAKTSGDRTNVINRIFASPESREKMVMALGDKGARDVEAFVRVEHAMDAARGALGNSSTARQLVELGLIGGGTWYYTGDFNKGVAVAAAAKGLKMGAQKIDQRVMKRVAEILLSDDPALIKKAMQNAAFSPKYLAAIQAVTKSIDMASRIGGIPAQSAAK
jgi:hypothetical protein